LTTGGAAASIISAPDQDRPIRKARDQHIDGRGVGTLDDVEVNALHADKRDMGDIIIAGLQDVDLVMLSSDDRDGGCIVETRLKLLLVCPLTIGARSTTFCVLRLPVIC
jgi:hypothetical protein